MAADSESTGRGDKANSDQSVEQDGRLDVELDRICRYDEMKRHPQFVNPILTRWLT